MSHIPEPLVVLTEVLTQDEFLRAWLLELESEPPEERAQTLTGMADRMREGGEDPALVQAIGALAHEAFYTGICRVIRELERA